MAAFLAGIVFVVFFPCLQNGFVYDDEGFLLRNVHYRGFGWQNIHWMFTTFYYGHYQPLAWMSLGLDYLLWGMKPRGYHFSNLVLHAANVVLVLLLARRLIRLSDRGGRLDAASSALDVGAGVAALLFAVHPLRVESVAWVTERRDVLSSFFLLIAVLLYLRAQQPDAAKWRRTLLATTLAAYLLSLLSRAMGVTLPLILLVLDVYPLRRLGGGPGRLVGREVRRVWLEKIPFIIPAMAAAIVAPIAQHYTGAMEEVALHGISERIAQACYGLTFYLHKSVLPVDLSPIYELRLPLNIYAARYVLSAIFVILVVAAIALLRRRYPALVAAAICYVILLLPVLGLVQSGPQEVADRYSYLPSIGWMILVGGIVGIGWGGLTRRAARIALAALMTLTAMGLGLMTWWQCFVWRDQLTLWRHAVEHGPPSAIAHYNYAYDLALTGDRDAAIVHLRKAIEIRPWYRDARQNLSNCLMEMGHYEEAIAGFQKVLQIDKNFARACYGMGRCYERLNSIDQAMDAYRNAIRISPAYVEPYLGLAGILVVRKKQYTAAIELYRQALDRVPGDRNLHFGLGIALDAAGKLDDALLEYREAIRIDPASVDVHINMGIVLARQGKIDEAILEYREALRMAPNHPAAKENLEDLLRRQRRN